MTVDPIVIHDPKGPLAEHTFALMDLAMGRMVGRWATEAEALARVDACDFPVLFPEHPPGCRCPEVAAA